MSEDVLWRLGPVTFYSLGFALSAGFLVATAAAVPLLRRRGVRQRAALRLMLWLMVGTVLGGRLAALLAAVGQRDGRLASLLVIPPDGLSYYGGLAAALIVIIGFCRRSGVPLLVVTDALAPPAALGLSLGGAVLLATNLLQLRNQGPAWLNVLPFTLSWALAYLLWRHRERPRFLGEPTLLFLGVDSLLRMLLGAFWTFGEKADGVARLGAAVTLALAAVAWFTLRGAAGRRALSVEAAHFEAAWTRRSSPRVWIVAYVGVLALMLLRLRAV